MVNPSPLKLPITAEDKTRAAFQSVQANLARTQAALRAMSAQWQSVERDTAGATNSIAAVGTHLSRLVPLLSIGAVASFGRNIVNSIGGLGELADQLGISTDLLQTLQATAIQSGVSVEQLEASMLKFTRTIGDAVSGSDDAIDRFRQLGVGLLDANGKTRSTLEIMQDVAVAISQIEDPTRRALMQFELFGKSGQRMQVLLQELSREGIEPMIGRMKEAGAVAQEDVIKRFDEISDRAAFAGKQFVVFSSSIIDGFIGIAGRAVEAAQRVGQFFGLFDQPLDKQLAAAETLLQRQTQLLERMVSGGRANKRDIDEQTAAVEAYRKKVEELRAAMSAPAPSAPAAPTLPGSPILPVGKKEMEDQRKQIESAEKAIADYNARIDQTILSLDPVAAATRRWSDQQAMLIDALDKGMVDLERYNELILASDMQYRGVVQRTMNVVELSVETAKKTDDIARDLGFTFQSAFEDAIVRGEKFRNVLAGIAQDIARITIRHPEDRCICITNRSVLETQFGIRFAPPDVAERFAVERSAWHPAFGFHGFFNFANVLEPEELARFIDGIPASYLGGVDAYDLIALLCDRNAHALAARLLAKCRIRWRTWREHLNARRRLAR